MGRKSRRGASWLAALAALPFVALTSVATAQTVFDWPAEFPLTNFSVRSIPLKEIVSDGAVRDSIQPIVDPQYAKVGDVANLGDFEPVLSIGIGDDFRAYPLRIMLFHEIVNEVIDGVPVLISYCPLCNSGVVFDRRVDGEVLEFGNTGRIRHFDMVMYDKATESWWQQFLGEAVVGDLTGKRMKALPARLESLKNFRERAPEGLVLVPNSDGARQYGTTPYSGMDSEPLPRSISRQRFPYDLPVDVDPLARVVVVGEEAWTLALLQQEKRIERDGLILTWQAGQNSIHDTTVIADGRDVGNVVVQRAGDGGAEDVPYDVVFAFSFAAFVPDGTLHFE